MARSEAAKAAAALKRELKDAGYNVVSCRSERYSGGSSVTAVIKDPKPDELRKAKEMANKHQKGHFDGMTDYYEYSNVRDDIPQVKYSFIEVEWSPEIKEKSLEIAKEIAGNAPIWEVEQIAHRIRIGIEKWGAKKLWGE